MSATFDISDLARQGRRAMIFIHHDNAMLDISTQNNDIIFREAGSSWSYVRGIICTLFRESSDFPYRPI